MKLFAAEDQEAMRLRRKVRWFLAVAALLILASVLAVAARQGVFTRVIPLHFFAESAQEINRGMPVKVLGFKIGKVEQVALEPDNRIKVRIAIDDSYARLIPIDSIAKVAKEGLIGTSTVEIQPGQDKARIVAANDVLRFERDSGLSDLAKRITDQVLPILRDVRQITTSINDPQGDIRQAVRNIGEATVAMRGSSQELQQLLHQSNEKLGALGGQMSSVLAKTDQNMTTVQRSLTTLDKDLPGILNKLDASLENVRRLSQDGADNLPGMLRDGKSVASDTREILTGARKSWPIRNLVDPPAPEPISIDSYVPTPEKSN